MTSGARSLGSPERKASDRNRHRRIHRLRRLDPTYANPVGQLSNALKIGSQSHSRALRASPEGASQVGSRAQPGADSAVHLPLRRNVKKPFKVDRKFDGGG